MVEKVEKDPRHADDLLKRSANDLKAAADNLRSGHPDWALAISYNAMLSAGMALMSAKGYRAYTEPIILLSCSSALPCSQSIQGRL